ncbi:hypothetical protein GGS21DRAFT_524870 [Xylaria nigripes]|nr:hypothetical protein GGS21DRAFT_524870 [Xylaria nigripes]
MHIALHVMDRRQSPSSGKADSPRHVPLSNYSTYRPHTFQPACTHLTMTRMYDLNFNCALCRRPGQ